MVLSENWYHHFFPILGIFPIFMSPTHISYQIDHIYIYMHTHIIYTHCAYLSHIFFHFISSYYIPIKPWDSLVKFSCFMVQPRCFTAFAVSAPVKPTIFLIKPDKATMFNGEPPCFTVSNLQQNKLPLQKSGAVALLLVFAWMAQWPPRRRNACRIFCWFDIYYYIYIYICIIYLFCIIHIISYYLLLYVIVCYYMLLYVIICYYMLLYVIICYYVLLYVIICYYYYMIYYVYIYIYDCAIYIFVFLILLYII